MVRKLRLILFLLLLSATAAAQRYSQYFTNTLFESFENPAQKVFAPDTTRMFASNFLVPNLTVNAYLTGNSQRAIKQYLFLNHDQNSGITPTVNQWNHTYANVNTYLFMLKVFTSLNGNQEVGFSEQIKGEGKALFSDATAILLNGGVGFVNGKYTGLFNDKLRYQTYHQLSITYRRALNDQLAFGLKLSELSGIAYNEFVINQSEVTFDQQNKRLFLGLAGGRITNLDPNEFSAKTVLPSFHNPGASISIGVSQQVGHGFRFQYNIKDLGFIRWANSSNYYQFNGIEEVDNLSSSDAGQRIFNAANKIFDTGGSKGSFTTSTDGRFELSATRSFSLGENNYMHYIPVAVASKQIFDNGFTGVLINNIQYRSLTLGVTTAYNEMRQFSLGGQLMIKSPNAEFFIGCEQLLPGYNLLRSARGNEEAITKELPFSAAGIFMGFSLKFGSDIETHQNASHIPMGEEGGFLRRLFHGVF